MDHDNHAPTDETRPDGGRTEHGAEAPLNGGEHSDAGSFAPTDDEGHDGAFTDSEIPDDGTAEGESHADLDDDEGRYTDRDSVG